jgi:hypothetical protein
VRLIRDLRELGDAAADQDEIVYRAMFRQDSDYTIPDYAVKAAMEANRVLAAAMVVKRAGIAAAEAVAQVAAYQEEMSRDVFLQQQQEDFNDILKIIAEHDNALDHEGLLAEVDNEDEQEFANALWMCVDNECGCGSKRRKLCER